MQKNINKYFRRAALNFKKKKKEEIERDKGWKTIRKRKKLYTASRSKRNPKDGWPKGGVSR